MVLSGPRGTRLKLCVQAQPHSPDQYDNWVTIEVQVQSMYGSWSASERCLLAEELDRLVDWFEQAAQRNDAPATLRFLEPDLAFQLSGVEPMQKILRVIFHHHLRPVWAPPDTWNDLWVEFPVTNTDLARAAHSLRQQIGRAPQGTSTRRIEE
jgi:hypothetical protein